jgi:hypothetical protein
MERGDEGWVLLRAWAIPPIFPTQDSGPINEKAADASLD